MVVVREQRLNAARLLLAGQGRPGSVASTGAAAAPRDEQQGGEDQPGGHDLGGHAPHLFRCGTPQPTAGSRMSAPTVLYSPAQQRAEHSDHSESPHGDHLHFAATAGGPAPGSDGSRNRAGNGCSLAMNETL